MGNLRDILTLIGVLPIEFPPNFKKKDSQTDLYIDKVEQLEELNGQYVWIRDFHKGLVVGELTYNSLFGDDYFLNLDCRKPGKLQVMKVHDLQSVF